MDKTNPKLYCLEIRGDFACFTRPELKVERVSYDVITPSAARNIFQCIFWKPAIIRKTKRAAHRKRSVHPHTPLRRNEALHFRGIYQGRSATIRTPFLHQSNRVGSSSLT